MLVVEWSPPEVLAIVVTHPPIVSMAKRSSAAFQRFPVCSTVIAEIGLPHFGHDGARSLTWLLQSGQVVRAIVPSGDSPAAEKEAYHRAAAGGLFPPGAALCS